MLLGVILFLNNSLHFNPFIECAMADFTCQILEQHIRMVLPSLKSELNSERYSVMKELETCGKAIASYVSCIFNPTSYYYSCLVTL